MPGLWLAWWFAISRLQKYAHSRSATRNLQVYECMHTCTSISIPWHTNAYIYIYVCMLSHFFQSPYRCSDSLLVTSAKVTLFSLLLSGLSFCLLAGLCTSWQDAFYECRKRGGAYGKQEPFKQWCLPCQQCSTTKGFKKGSILVPLSFKPYVWGKLVCFNQA